MTKTQEQAGDSAQARYAQADLIRLRDDPEFQRRVGADEELARLFCPQHEDLDIRDELAVGLGMSRRIAGVDLPPVTLGRLVLLTTTGNEFVKDKRDWSQGVTYQMGQLTEALFILANGAKAVTAFADVFRFERTIQAWRKDAAMSPHIAKACMDAECKRAASLQLWDATVLTWGARYMRLEDGETWQGVVESLEDWIVKGLDGFKLFPQVQPSSGDKETAQYRPPFGFRRKLRLSLSRALVRFALALVPTRCGGRSPC